MNLTSFPWFRSSDSVLFTANSLACVVLLLLLVAPVGFMPRHPEEATSDNVDSSSEDVNGNGILTDDDTDKDGLPNYLDDDDDGDGLLTRFELSEKDKPAKTPFLNTDNDELPNYLDDDDDNDGKKTINENADPNRDGNPADAADGNQNKIPDYLEPFTAGVQGSSGKSPRERCEDLLTEANSLLAAAEEGVVKGVDTTTLSNDAALKRLILERASKANSNP